MDRHLEAVTIAVANADPRYLPVTIRRAYDGGASLDRVLVAIEMGRCLYDVPAPVLQVAWEAAHAWAWIARRDGEPGESGIMGQPAQEGPVPAAAAIAA